MNFANDMHQFFKVSSARREKDYESMENITEVVAKYVLKHSSARWLTLKYIALLLYEQ